MKAQELIALLQTIAPDAEVVTPGFDEYGAASEFKLNQVWVVFDIRKATPHFAPHEIVSPRTHEAVVGYSLNGDW